MPDEQSESHDPEHPAMHFMAFPAGMIENILAMQRGDNVTREAGQEARDAIRAAMDEEYLSLHMRATDFDHLLSPDESPELATGAKAWTLHKLAARQAERLAKGLDDMGRAAEYRAQALEHRAAVERWAVKMARSVKLMERLSDATKTD